MADYGVVLFYSTAHAIRAERVLQRAGLKIKMIPTPRQLSSDCGIALRFFWEDEGRVAATLEQNNVPANGIHLI
jgi:hypothetical protein